ncbi:hypothetical protein FKX85_19705 [Echinicola soli]|uniref:HTH luxR-type domain-containing protein n=1 Tax=Echinicola soli TaxID=2591634 RepID=A0A514CMT7_9BACT|nr:LuxR C-terminal-related transcriptional regulator [Echinicola soli]QDH81135.1 hypothetical protein FKX85_19705 [Echinicola soli]
MNWNSKSVIGGDSTRFITAFCDSHPTFVSLLKSHIPDINPKDFKVCALLKLDYHTKEIAHMTNCSLRSIEARKYRIRKRLGIPSNANLTLYLMELESGLDKDKKLADCIDH